MAYPASVTRRGYVVGTRSLLFLLVFLVLAYDRSESPKLQAAHSKDDILKNISNTTLGFQKIFVISLPSRTDHRDVTSLAAASTGLEFEFVDGVADVSHRALPPGGENLGLTNGALGNWRAHMNVAQRWAFCVSLRTIM